MKKIICMMVCAAALFASTLNKADDAYVDGKYEEAAKLYEKACDEGDMQGCYNLGAMHENERGVKYDMQKAVSLYEKACNGDNVYGCYNLAMVYSDLKDYAKAIPLLTKACNGKDGMACFNLGVFNFKGEGMKEDKKAGNEFFKKACEYGTPEGCYELARSYVRGQGVELNFKKAEEFHAKACEMHHARGCYNVGALNTNPKAKAHMKQDRDKAKAFFKQGCDLGDEQSCENLMFMELGKL